MAKPVSGYLGYDESVDRPTVLLASGRKTLLTIDDAGGGGSVTTVDSPTTSITVTNPTGPTVSVEVARGTGANQTRAGNDAAYTDARTPTGAAGGDLAGSYPNPTVTNLEDLRSLIVARPTSAHADNDEFESTTLNAAWLWKEATAANVTMTSWSASPPTAADLTQHTAGDRYRLHTDRRRSWLQWQATEGGNFKGLFKPFTSATDLCAHTMMSMPYIYDGSATNNAMFLHFVLCADSGGQPDLANSLQIGVDQDGTNQYFLRCQEVIAGATSTLPFGGSANSYSAVRFSIPYFGFRKRGTSYSHYAGDESYHLRFGGERTFSPTIAWVGYLYFTATATNEFPIWGVNWLRRQNDLLALPW